MRSASRAPVLASRPLRPVVEPVEHRCLLAATNFTIDPALSSITVAASYTSPLGNGTFAAQATGSLSAKYAGTIKTDLTATSIKFVGGSNVDAVAKTGTFRPGGTSADYAGTAPGSLLTGRIDAAARGVIFDLTSAAALTVGSGGTFNDNALQAKATAGTLAYSSTLTGTMSETLVGSTAGNASAASGTLVTSGAQRVLTIPVGITYIYTAADVGATVTLRFSGQIVAKAPAPVVVGSIAGTVFHDTNGNGTRQTGEAAQSNVRVYIDRNNNAIFDSGETSKLTLTDGSYKFTGLAAGTYNVREVVPSGFYQVAPAGGKHTVALAAGANVTGKLFANARYITIKGIAFNDTNRNGTRESTEALLANVRINLDLDNNGTTDRTVLTNASGAYTFSSVKVGTHKLSAVKPTGKTYTVPSTGIYTFATASGTVYTRNFGFRPV